MTMSLPRAETVHPSRISPRTRLAHLSASAFGKAQPALASAAPAARATPPKTTAKKRAKDRARMIPPLCRGGPHRHANLLPHGRKPVVVPSGVILSRSPGNRQGEGDGQAHRARHRIPPVRHQAGKAFGPMLPDEAGATA